MRKLPTGTVTFLFSDIEGSTRLLQEHPAAYPEVLERHRALLRAAFAASGGVEVETEGDSLFVAFPSAMGAVSGAAAGQRAIAVEEWPDGIAVRVRMGLLTGEAAVRGSGYVGLDIHRTARLAAAGHGGQVLVSGQTRGLVETSLPDGLAFRDLGEHRLRDIEAPELIGQLVIDGMPDSFPPLRTATAALAGLPAPVTSFVGRTDEVAAVAGLLEDARVVTLVGPGGVGKTRLSLEVAHRVVGRYRDGVTFVPLAALREVELVIPAIASELGLPERGGREPTRSLLDHLSSRQTLLVIDNFEHLLPAASEVATLLAAPEVTLLVTSRAPLRIYGEQRYPVPALSLPGDRAPADPDALARSDAVMLFVARATAADPDFALTTRNAAAVAEICARLDGLPLAIELAAARVSLLPPDAILSKLGDRLSLRGAGRDLPARQQTLRDAIAWSHDLLDESDRRAFAGLSVFLGGADLEAIEAILGEPETDALDALAGLVDGSLVRRVAVDGEARFGMLDTIREFAAEQLEATGRADELHQRHAEYFAALVERARPLLLGNEAGLWLDRLERDHDNLRAVLAWAAQAGQVDLALRLSAGLWRFWQRRGYLAEGLARVRAALAIPGPADPGVRADAYEAGGGLAYWQVDAATTREMYEACLALRRKLGDERALAEALYNLAFSYTWLTDPESGVDAQLEAAHGHLAEARAIFERLGDRAGVAKAVWGIAVAETWTMQLREAVEHAQDAVRLARELDDRFLLAWSLFVEGVDAIALGDLDRPEASLNEALALLSASNDVSGYTLVLDAFATLALRRGDRERAARISGAVAQLEATSGITLQRINRKVTRFDPEELRLDPALQAAWADGAATQGHDMVAEVLRLSSAAR